MAQTATQPSKNYPPEILGCRAIWNDQSIPAQHKAALMGACLGFTTQEAALAGANISGEAAVNAQSRAGTQAKAGAGTGNSGAVQRRRLRAGSRREALLNIIQGSGGVTRGQILDRMGLKGDQRGEMSVSNALTTLTKLNQVHREDGKYIFGPASEGGGAVPRTGTGG